MEESIVKKRLLIKNLSLFTALLFHVCGVTGMLFTSYSSWFIQATPVTLLLMFILLIINQRKPYRYFILFVFIAFFTGLAVEMMGVNTGILFGDYKYGIVLGYKVNNVPWLIGINWFIIVYCAGCLTHLLEEKLINRSGMGMVLSKRIQTISFLLDAAMLITFFDWLMEPVAVKLGYWKWGSDDIPDFNYMCWFFISLLLLFIFRKLPFNKHNMFAVHLFIIQVLFFLILRTFL
jgi:bisanhydrobacterioruberin hydratase